MSATLYYIYDPLCGWCYGAEPLVRAAAAAPGLELELQAGGLWPRPTQLPPDTRSYIRSADARIAHISGQPFGDAYLQGLLADPTLVLESRPPVAAVLAAQSLDPAAALPMLAAIQHAHYERGLRVVEPEVLIGLAIECGLERDAFAAAFDAAPADTHIAETRALMARVGAAGFPTFVLEVDDRRLNVPHTDFAADPEGFAEWLVSRIRADGAGRAAAR